jgi:Glycosyl hydrolase family 1
VLADDGNVYDTDRIMFLRNCLTQLQRATVDGVPVKGYFQWSTMDNFEWNAGYGKPFRHRLRGLHDAEAHAQDERVILSRDRAAQRGRVGATTEMRQSEGGPIYCVSFLGCTPGKCHRNCSSRNSASVVVLDRAVDG